MYLLIPKLPIPTPRPPPPSIPRHLTGVFLLTVEIWKFVQWGIGLLGENSGQHHKQKDSFHIVHNMHHDHGSLLLYSLFCWGIREPLEKPVNGVKCKLSEMNNFIELNKHL